MRFLSLITVVAAFSGCAAPPPATRPGPLRPLPVRVDAPAEIAALVERLGDAQFDRRAAAHSELEKLGITDVGHVRAWLQAFTLGKPVYGPEQLQAEKRAVYDAGYRDWVMWNPGSTYDVYVPALDKKPAAAASGQTTRAR